MTNALAWTKIRCNNCRPAPPTNLEGLGFPSLHHMSTVVIVGDRGLLVVELNDVESSRLSALRVEG